VNLTRDDPFPLLGMEPAGTGEVHGWDRENRPRVEQRTWMWGESEEMGAVVCDLGRGLDYRVDRGLIDAVRCPLAQWLAHGPAVAKAHPLLRVTLTDREPRLVAGGDWTFYFGPAGTGQRHWLPSEFGALMPSLYYPAAEGALGALSDACILWARAQP
jgi:hypothetical protein